jgi:hypothetical protein
MIHMYLLVVSDDYECVRERSDNGFILVNVGHPRCVESFKYVYIMKQV